VSDPVFDSNVVAPTLADSTANAGAEFLGGPLGRRARSAGSWLTPVRIVVLAALGAFIFGYFLKAPCLIRGWGGVTRYSHLCYSDIPPLYQLRGFAGGYFPYLQHAPGAQPLEYPVLTGMFMLLAASLTPAGASAILWFYDVNVVLLGACLFVAVAATAMTVRRRPWDGLLVALAPGVFLAGMINWDLLAVALTAVSMAAWARKHVALSGVFLGLAIAAKFYPVVLVFAVVLLCLRAGRLKSAAKWLAAVVATWLLVNAPFMILAPTGWAYFYKFSATRGQDFGSVWLALSIAGIQVPAKQLSMYLAAVLLVLFAAITVLTLNVRRRPRIAQVSFLVIAAFVLANKVYSPQYVLWLIPFAALARPRWRDFLVWQLCEVGYFAAIWWYLVSLDAPTKGLPSGWYAVAIAVHIGGTVWFAGRVVRDMIKPEYDPVRADGLADDADDPGGGVLDGALDHFVLPLFRKHVRVSQVDSDVDVDDDRSMV